MGREGVVLLANHSKSKGVMLARGPSALNMRGVGRIDSIHRVGRALCFPGSMPKDYPVQPQQTSLKRPKFTRLAWFGLALALSAATNGLAQTPPLARYVPQQDLLFYFEFEGLESHADTWKKTAAYKVLNDTKTGAMLEDLLAQVYDKVIRPNNKDLRFTGTETVTLAKSALQSGFVVAFGGKTNDPSSMYGVAVFRNAFRKETKPLFGKLVAIMNGPTGKAALVTKGNHKVVAVTDPKLGPRGDWWVDDEKKEDLIISTGPPRRRSFWRRSTEPNQAQSTTRFARNLARAHRESTW